MQSKTVQPSMGHTYGTFDPFDRIPLQPPAHCLPLHPPLSPLHFLLLGLCFGVDFLCVLAFGHTFHREGMNTGRNRASGHENPAEIKQKNLLETQPRWGCSPSTWHQTTLLRCRVSRQSRPQLSPLLGLKGSCGAPHRYVAGTVKRSVRCGGK